MYIYERTRSLVCVCIHARYVRGEDTRKDGTGDRHKKEREVGLVLNEQSTGDKVLGRTKPVN